jgi:glucosylceramidase
VLSDPKAYKYITGVGYQWAGKYAIQRSVQAFPEKKYMQTENECGDGTNTWFYARYISNLYQHYLSNGAHAYIYWNMALEPQGRSTWGWTQNAMITITAESKEVTQNPEYFVMKHFAHFLQPGDVRLATSGPWSANAVAFKKPNGQKVVVLTNQFPDDRELVIEVNGELLAYQLKGHSFNTIVI